MFRPLSPIVSTPALSLYRVRSSSNEDASPAEFVGSTPETRAICNDPFIFGVQYTRLLQSGCGRILRGLREQHLNRLKEEDTVVLNILRGGLNFGLRDALAEAFGWNLHSSAFISAQRARVAPESNDWIITEREYQKLQLRPQTDLLFGDVVATGTSLEYGLAQVVEAAERQGAQIRSVVFFTIGSPRSSQIIEKISSLLSKKFSSYQQASVVYLEGIFDVAGPRSKLRVKIDGTDLLRGAGSIATEFLKSQLEHPAFPLERCTIYDAGSRAFEVREYLQDVLDYWEDVEKLAAAGVGYADYLNERFPAGKVEDYNPRPSLPEVSEQRVRSLRAAIEQFAGTDGLDRDMERSRD